MWFRRLPFLIVLFVLLSEFGFSQTGLIKGFVYDKKNGEPMMYINVYLYETKIGSTTDGNGYFVISRIPEGNYILIVSSIGYDTLKIDVDISKNEVVNKKFYLKESVIQLKAINISAEKQENIVETKVSVSRITPKQIKQLPSIGGQPDLAQYLQVLPGIIFTGDQGGQLYIRGGSPVQNKVLLDGMVVFNPFHSIGLFSVFDTDVLRSADVYTGGFGAEYGDRISSVMDITTRSGNNKRYSGKLEASTFGSRILLEGPLKKLNDSTGGSSSFIISAKNSYLQQTSKVLYKYIDKENLPINSGNFFKSSENEVLPYNYTDLFGKMSFESSNGSKFNIFGFNFADKVNNYKALSDFHWNSFGIGSNFYIIPGKSPVVMEGTIAYSDYKIGLDEKNSTLPRKSEIDGFNVGLNFTYFLKKDEIKYGFELVGFNTQFDFFNSVGREIKQDDNSTEFGLYFKYKMTRGKFIIEPSLRAQYYGSLSEFSPEPRLAVKFNATSFIRFKLAGGFYSQNLISANYDRDVVNLFYGFLSGPDNLPVKFEGNDVNSKLQRAQHLIFGIEIDPMNNLTINIEPYYKNFSQLTNLNKDKIYDENVEYYSNQPDILKKDFIIEKGYAKGIDFSAKFEYRHLYIWGVYSLGYVSRDDATMTYAPHYDRRHNSNIVASYQLGRNYQWEFSTRWNFGSGFPFTKTQGYFEKNSFSSGINTDYTTDNGTLAIQYDTYNGGRLPPYHRLDLTIKRKFFLGKYTNLDANFSIINIYNRKNVFYADRITGKTIYQLPTLASLGFTFSF